MTSTTMSRAGAAMLACALASCGGGSGDSSGGVQVTLDHSTISSIAVDDSGWTPDVVGITISGGSGNYYVGAVSDNDAFETDLQILSDTRAQATVRATGALNAGTSSTGHITYKLCTDQACSHTVWSRALPYTITRYRIDNTPIAITGNEGVAAAPFMLAVTPADTGHQLAVFSTDTTLLTADHTDPARIVLTLAPPRATSGVLSATLIVGAPSGQTLTSLAQVPVAMTVNSDLLAPAIAPIVVMGNSTPQSLAGSAAVRFAVPENRAWSATTDKSWLVLDSPTGTGPGNLQYHVDTTQLGGLPNWSSDVATLTISSPGLSTVTLPVTLSLHLPEIASVTPGAVLAGQASTLQLTGRGLSQLAGVGSLHVSGAVASGGSIVSDTAATLQLPALSSGTRSVSVSNLLSLPTQSAPFVVEVPSALAAAFVPNPGMNRAIAYDATRHAVFAANIGTSQYSGTDALVRYQLTGSTWQATSLPLPSIGYLALAPDRATVYVESAGNLLAIDPDTMQVRSSTAAPDPSLATPSFYFDQPMPITADQRLWLSSYYYGALAYYDLRTGTFGTASVPPAPETPFGLYEPHVYGPAGGANLYVASCTCSSPTGPSYWLDVAGGQFQHDAAMPILNQATFDDAGSLMLEDNVALYRTDTWALVGYPTVSGSNQGNGGYGAVLSPDGTRLYREVTSNSAIDHLEVFDTHATVAGGTNLVSLGTIALPDKATSCFASGTYFCDGSGRLAMDPTGTTLFWAGENGLVVVPIPSAMSGISSAPRAHAATGGRLAGSATGSRR